MGMNLQFYPNIQAQRPDHWNQHQLHLSAQPTGKYKFNIQIGK